MPFRKISSDIKERALWLIEHEYAPSEICDILGFSLASLRRWRRNRRLHGSLHPPRNPNRGRPTLITSDIRRDMYMLLSEAPDMYLDEVQEWLVIARDVKMSITTVHRLISDAGLTYKQLEKAAIEQDEEQR
ncbi:hypothetical protein PUNSTDRAFT_33903, partial [Punctularia strigosozonata HHB-11173 SS5]|uniref:uncharacterized protein n=1 Tax=Punctularia strigosozonata (strain HHB-11173) TaxID=741275 RepID=UPI0004416F7F